MKGAQHIGKSTYFREICWNVELEGSLGIMGTRGVGGISSGIHEPIEEEELEKDMSGGAVVMYIVLLGRRDGSRLEELGARRVQNPAELCKLAHAVRKHRFEVDGPEMQRLSLGGNGESTRGRYGAGTYLEEPVANLRVLGRL